MLFGQVHNLCRVLRHRSRRRQPNRIALLKMEEKKAWKKIQETKRKAEQVMVIRNRNAEDRERKENIRKMREDDAAMKAERNA